jgi:hypothetical protein
MSRGWVLSCLRSLMAMGCRFVDNESLAYPINDVLYCKPHAYEASAKGKV